MTPIDVLTPNEVAALAGTSKTVVEKALEQNVFGLDKRGASQRSSAPRLLPLYAVAIAATAQSLGRRLTVNDKKLMARRLADLSPHALKTAEVEIASAIVVRVGFLAGAAIAQAERYLAARDSFIEKAEGVQGGRPVIKGTRVTISAVHGRLSSADTIDDLVDDYPDISREAFEAAFLYARMHPQVGRPQSRTTARS